MRIFIVVFIAAILVVTLLMAFFLVSFGFAILDDPGIIGRFFGQIAKGFEEVQ